jgi:energy-coupling factor transporter transmembrane protein EcfT
MKARTKSATTRFAKVFLVLNGIIAICQGLTIIFGFIAAYLPSKRAWAFIGIATPLVLAIWKWASWHKVEIEAGQHMEEATLFEKFLDWITKKKPAVK